MRIRYAAYKGEQFYLIGEKSKFLTGQAKPEKLALLKKYTWWSLHTNCYSIGANPYQF